MTELSGTLEGVGLPAIVRFLAGLSKTGCLHIAHADWRGEIFFDAGQVGGNGLTNSLYSRSSLGASVGFGFRVNVPMIGMVRLDYGMPLLSTLLGSRIPRFTVGFGEKF